MGISYDCFTGAFLSKITEFELVGLELETQNGIVDGYMKRAISSFRRICKYDLVSTANDEVREFDVTIEEDELEELVDIISEGMVVQWLKPYVYKQELLENAINTRDFTTYSPAELLMRVGNAYRRAQKDYTQMMRDYSYSNGDLSDLHL